MVAVNTIDGIKYGFRLLGYLIAVFLIGGLIAGFGAAMAEDSPAVGGIIAIIGAVIIYAGFLGTMYKVIADGVQAGNVAAQRGHSPPAATQGGGQPPAGRGAQAGGNQSVGGEQSRQ
jgi:hypothetical protein